MQRSIKILKEAGYGITMQVLNASFCGVPQARKRFFMIGNLKEDDNFLLPYLEKNLSKKPMTIHDYFGDSLKLDYYYRHPRSYMRRGIFSVHEPSPTIRGVNRPIPSGYKKHSGDPIEITTDLRPLTTLERSYIQTFPKSFKFRGTKTNLEQIIGNAVPVKLSQYIANCINEFKNDKQRGNKYNFQLFFILIFTLIIV